MIAEAMQLISRGIAAALTWAGQLFSAIPGSSALILSAFFLFTVFRFILGPLALKSGAADRARRNLSGDKSDGG